MNAKLLNEERLKVILIVSFTYIFPILLMSLGFISFSLRFTILILANIVILMIARLYRFSFVELGFTQKNLGKALRAITPTTLGFALLMIIYFIIYGSRIDNSSYGWTFYLFFIGLSAPIQELLYRGFLFGIFSRVKLVDWLKILLSSLLYSLVHLIYRDILTLLLTFVIGLLWGWHYIKYQNLYSVIVSHSVLGGIAIFVGLI